MADKDKIEDIENLEPTQLLTEEEVWDVLEFSKGLAQELTWLKNGVYTPDILHSNLLALNNNAKVPTYDSVIKSLADAVGNVETINSFVQYMNTFDTIFNKTIEYKCGLLSYDLAYVCTNAKGKSDYKSKEYKEDEARVRKFLFNFDYKKYFSIVTKNLIMNGKYFAWFREGKKEKGGAQKYALQMLPQDYCKITGYSNMGALFDVNLSFLLNSTVDIDLYAEVFGKYYEDLFNSDGAKHYIPSNPLDKRNGSWAYWVQTSPVDGAWGFLFDESNFAGLSPMAPFLKDTILGAELQKLQYNKDMAGAKALLSGEIVMNKNSKQCDDFAISPKLLGQLLALVQSGLGDLIKVCAMPAENTKFYQYQDTNKEMYNDTVKNTTALGASASRLIYGTDKASQAEIESQITNDAQPLIKLYRQYEQFLDYFINQKTQKYKFKFNFTGLNYEFDQIKRKENLEFIVDRGVVPNLTFFAQALGYEPHIFEQAVEEGAWGNLEDKLASLRSIHTASSGSFDKGGRPRSRRAKDSNTYRGDS